MQRWTHLCGHTYCLGYQTRIPSVRAARRELPIECFQYLLTAFKGVMHVEKAQPPSHLHQWSGMCGSTCLHQSSTFGGNASLGKILRHRHQSHRSPPLHMPPLTLCAGAVASSWGASLKNLASFASCSSSGVSWNVQNLAEASAALNLAH